MEAKQVGRSGAWVDHLVWCSPEKASKPAMTNIINWPYQKVRRTLAPYAGCNTKAKTTNPDGQGLKTNSMKPDMKGCHGIKAEWAGPITGYVDSVVVSAAKL